MDKPSFEKAVELAMQYREQAEAGWQQGATERPSEMMMLGFLIQTSATSRSDWDAVNLIAQQHLRNGAPLPGMLASWVADVLAKKRKRPTQRGQPPKKKRNGTIVHVLKKLQEVGFHPTRNNEAPEHRSGCDVVAEAFGLKYKTVESVWRAFRKWETEAIAEAEWRWLGFDVVLTNRE